MKLQRTWLWPLLSLPIVCACQSAAEDATAPAKNVARVDLVDRPQSSLVALVRILEALDALHDPQVEVRIRALECDTLPAQREKPPHVRVVLDLTLYAEDYERAERARETLMTGLEEEGRATARLQTAASYRVQRVFKEMPWNAPRVHSERDFAGLVSVSDSVQVEVYEASQAKDTVGEGSGAAPQSSNVVDYIDAIAHAPEVDMGPLHSHVSPRRLRDNRTDLRYRIRPLSQLDSFGRHQIGAFLAGLESGSPGVRITHLEIAPSDPGEDVKHDLWSFQADLTLRITQGPERD